ncbi:nitrogen fixation protein NifX [Aneurinibacillus terranovensis]|uniref:nitrogen fixation protein NifX n=1 Tax=Aneurinibacillus terranovensis TaxID=278991 RepID=UPI000410DA93|nr:nitrogen fixation protein NifX [Aneurinibacillus terranovensis]
MRVAFATDDGKLVNSHFGHCESFAIYEVTTEKFTWIATRQVQEAFSDDELGKIDARLNAIKDCTLIFITQIGASAAARVTRNKIMPVKVEHEASILGQLDRLLTMLKTKPPLWLVKALNNNEGKEPAHES